MQQIPLDAYAVVAGGPVIDDLKLLAGKLKGRRIQHINSTAVGGGVAEILNRMVPLLNELGVNTSWDVIKGSNAFFDVTKKFHNLLHGTREPLTFRDLKVFLETSRHNISAVDTYGDIVFVHDPQPIVLIEKKKDNKWIWRCHVDVSNPARNVWDFLMRYIVRYDAAVFSHPAFSQRLPIRQFLISPSIDPLSEKNRELSPEEIDGVFRRYGIPRDKPVVTQISRFDRLKDPLGVIEAFLKVRTYIDCRLVLAGGTAVDDPEGMQVYQEALEKANKHPDIHLLLMKHSDFDVNALQRGSDIIVQKSLKEGFGLTVSEALWKAKPVVASNVGGIPLQVKHKFSGLLCHSVDGAAFAIKQLLGSPAYARRLGENGREHVRNNFLLTRHLKEYMLLFLSLFHSGDVIYL
jgi:trehalose synthase